MADAIYSPKDFADEAYAKEYAQSFDRYAELRVFGKTKDMALIEAFELIKYSVDLGNLHQLAYACEVNPYVQRKFNELLEGKDPKTEMWSEKKAINRLLQLIEDPGVRDTTRLNAINALNVLCGYVSLDDGLARRVGHTLADFAILSAADRRRSPPATPEGDQETPTRRVH
jgi:hypothetical protein